VELLLITDVLGMLHLLNFVKDSFDGEISEIDTASEMIKFFKFLIK
jgi:hypothetical protein